MKKYVSRRSASRRRLLIRRVVKVSGVSLLVLIAVLRLPRLWSWMNSVSQTYAMPTDPSVLAALGGTRFTLPPPNPSAPPRFRVLATLDAPNANAIWGASGRDHRGHLWFATSSADSAAPPAKGEPPRPLTARLYEFDPAVGSISERGDSLEQLRLAGLLQSGLSQQKIHTKIVEAPDGFLYFATSDETGAVMSGTKGPTWPSHVWRIRPGTAGAAWEHLFTAPEALIAVALGGRYVYALGWFGHVIYQYDILTGAHISERVGSSYAHISRNILADPRGHVYVPRLTSSTSVPPVHTAVLVELDSYMREVEAVELPHYLGASPQASHGITGVQPMADGSIVFVTYPGYLYQVTPQHTGPSLVKEIGRFHPTRDVLVESLFSYDGRRYLVGLATPVELDQVPNDWVVYDLETGKVTAEPVSGAIEPLSTVLTLGDSSRPQTTRSIDFLQLALYGCSTRDDQGNLYLVGRDATSPVILRAQPPGMGPPEPPPSKPLTPPATASLTENPPVELSPLPPELLADPIIRELAKSDPVPVAKKPIPTIPASVQARSNFRRELRAILKAQGDQSAGAIAELCRRSGTEIPPSGEKVFQQAATLAQSSPIPLDRKIQMLRGGEVPEAAILNDLARTEAMSIGTRDGPKNKAEALVRAARLLALIPLEQ